MTNELTDAEVNAIVTGNWTPGQVAVFEQAHEGLEPQGQMMIDSLFCTCGGKYIHCDTMQPNHPTEGVVTVDSYRCDKCETWCIITWDIHGVEVDRQYEVDEE